MRAPPRVLLVGMMGAGKTTVGRAVAARTGWPYLDNDELVERATGRPTPEVLADADEATLRRVERAALDEALATPPPLVAGVAGGVITDPAACERLRRGGFVVYLRAPLALLEHRVAGGAGRPWLAGEHTRTLAELFAGREERYAGVADLVLDVEGVGPDALAEEIVSTIDDQRGARGDRPRG